MKDIGKLMDAICEAYHMARPGGVFAPICAEGRWYTHCNEAFNLICRRMGHEEFDRRETKSPTDAQLANTIYRMMKAADGQWRQIDPVLAQTLANKGALVAAVRDNANGPGHVCVVMPGQLEWSTSYQAQVPKVMNVGKDVFIGKKASFAFRKEDRPSYFCLKADFETLPGVS